MMRRLTGRDRAILDFEKQYFRFAGAKEEAIREAFDLSPVRYYQLLNEILDLPEALAAEPALVSRLLAVRDRRRATSRPA